LRARFFVEAHSRRRGIHHIASHLRRGCIGIIGASALASDKAPEEAMDFANSVASATEFEIQSSQLAQKNAKSAEIKIFADQTIVDHTESAGDFQSGTQRINGCEGTWPTTRNCI
jgi:hypothetical protein